MDEFISLTDLGKLYGTSSHQVGRWLKNLGLRTESGQPSAQAFKENYVSQRPSAQPNTYFYVWHRGKTTELLDAMCYPRANHDSEQRQHRAGTS
ncbi:MAG TPA: hypothetical protein VHY91_13610 [Pirellulales bacterium]|jgi:hypothetical protein|nr:hypothetical protein [Pirellulales bacterium]